MDVEAREELLAKPQVAVLATQWTRGRIHQAPVWFLYRQGAFAIITERGSQKHRNVLRSGRASLCVDRRDDKVAYVLAEGPVTVADTVSYDERLTLHRHYRGDENARKIVDQGGHEKMVKLTLTPERWISWP